MEKVLQSMMALLFLLFKPSIKYYCLTFFFGDWIVSIGYLMIVAKSYVLAFECLVVEHLIELPMIPGKRS